MAFSQLTSLCELHRAGHWKDAILVLLNGLVDLAATASRSLERRDPCELHRAGHWKDAILVLHNGLVDLAAPASLI